ncbi:MAG: glycosyl transferase family 1 [Elusimicrobia bacterium RIFOXYD2_FULL_34_15]|nr:MAG: glycosyl transferase family 1 [Elusimicrobia bacterium RIFOXYD2_FULL_34_15]
MKVTMMAKEYPPYVYGGAGVHLRYLAQELSKIMDVDIRCFGDQNSSADSLKVKGYKGWEALKGKKFSPTLETLSVNLLAQMEEIDSDVVHTHTWYGHFGGLMAKILYDIPFVATCHSLEPLRPWKEDQLGHGYQLSTWTEKIGIESADKVIAVSNLMKQDILKFFNIKPEKIEVIYNGVDLNKWKYTPLNAKLKKEYGIADDYILFVGRPTPQKGMEYLIDAADDIPCQIVLGATGADTKDYEDAMTKKVAKKKNIVWIHKLLKEEEYIQLYSSAKVFVCPSIYEPFGIINLEAMSCKTPVVASATGGILEVVLPEETGILVEPKNSKQIADSVNRLLKDDNLRKKLGENSRARVEKYFSWENIAGQTKKLYEGLIK